MGRSGGGHSRSTTRRGAPDIQLGRTSAFEIVEAIGLDAIPLVVFVTAYDRHAVKAFEMHALVRPICPLPNCQ